MRHRKKVNHLGRKSEHRKAMLSNMAASLILQKRITTTLAKAKALAVYVEPLITKSKDDSTHSRRTVFSYLHNKFAVSELFREVALKVASRPGGYTRILKTGFRKGDGAEMCMMELVDYNLSFSKTPTDAPTKTRRSRRGKKTTEGAESTEGKVLETKPAAKGKKDESDVSASASKVNLKEQASNKVSDEAELKGTHAESDQADLNEKQDTTDDSEAKA